MASPFRFFRKHTKVFLAVAAVLAIFIFVVGDALSRGGGGSGDGRSATQTVATWEGGKLNSQQLNSLVGQRMLTDEFLKRLFVQGGGQTGYDFPTSIPPLLLNNQEVDQVETEVIGMEVIASLAEQAGMSVSDSVINHYIEEMGLKKVGGEQVRGILESLGQGNARANEAIVFNTLRKMLLAYFYRRAYADASLVVLPQQRWDDWRKVNERISVEAAVLPVEKFLAEVPEPNEAQIQAFYEKYKEADPGRYVNVGGRELPIAEPGFAEPRRVRLQYLLGSVAGRTEQMMEKVTEEEIAEYYERNKRTEFQKMDLPDSSPFGAPDSDTPAAPPSEQPGEASEQPAEGAAAPAAEASAATPETPAAESAEAPAEPGEAPVETDVRPTEPAEPTDESTSATPANNPAQPPAEADAPAAEADGNEASSAVATPSPFRLVAFQEPAQGEPEPEVDAPAADGAADAGDEAAAGDANEPSAETPATEEQPNDEPPVDAAEPPAESPATGETPPAAATGVIDPAAALPANDDVEFEPLENVRDEIRKKLATDKAVEELERIMGEAAAQLQAEYNRYGSAVAEAKELDKKPPAAPAKLTDLKWLADQYGLTYEKTTPLTIRELYDTAVGKAGDAGSQRVSVTQAAYQSLDLFEPMLAQELEGDWYLVMKTEDTPRRVPDLKEARDEVVQAWKRAEAAKLAEKKAKELAAEVTKSGGPFDQFFFAERGFEVAKPTAFFSWRNYPVGRAGSGTPPGLSDVPELKNIGPEFMDAAFSLDGKEAVAVMNSDQSAAYVIRLDRKQYTDEELKRLFLEEEGSWPGRIDMMGEHNAIFNNAVEKEILEVRAGLDLNEEWLAERNERLQARQN